MNKLRAVTLSAVAAATFAGSASSNPEQAVRSTNPRPESPSAPRMVEMKVASVCAALGELKGILGVGDPDPLRMFSDGENVFGTAVFSPEGLHEQTDKVEATLMVDKDAIRGDQLGIDGLAAIVTSRHAADATSDVFEQFAEYEDPLEAAATIDQTEATELITQAREATDTAIQTNCS